MPYGTFVKCLLFQEPFKGSGENIARGVFVPIQDESTARTDVRAHAQRLLDHSATRTTLLGGPLWRDGDHWHVMEQAIVAHPSQECAPSSVVNTLGKSSVAYHVAYLQVFVGNQIVRCDKRVCRFPGKIFALPLDLLVRSG